MSTSDASRAWIGAIIGIIVTLLCILTLPAHPHQPCGILLPTKMTRPPISVDQVQLYGSAPSTATSLGIIQISRHYDSNHIRDDEAEIINKAKELAAAAGANGIYVQFFGHTPAGTPSGQARYFVWLYAFYQPTTSSFLASPINWSE